MNPASSEKELENHLQAISPSTLTTCLYDFKILENSQSTQIARLKCKFLWLLFLKVRIISLVLQSHVQTFVLVGKEVCQSKMQRLLHLKQIECSKLNSTTLTVQWLFYIWKLIQKTYNVKNTEKKAGLTIVGL